MPSIIHHLPSTMQGWQIQTVFGVFILWPWLSKAISTAANLWRRRIACRTHHTTSPSVNMEALSNLSCLAPSLAPETQRVIDHHVQYPPPYPSTQHSTKSNMSLVGTVIQCHAAQTGAWAPLLLLFTLFNVSRLRMGPRSQEVWNNLT